MAIPNDVAGGVMEVGPLYQSDRLRTFDHRPRNGSLLENPGQDNNTKKPEKLVTGRPGIT